MGKDEFIAELLNGLGAPPAYFPQNVMMNISGYESLEKVIEKSLKFLSPSEFKSMVSKTEALVLDVRHESDFVTTHIPGSIFIGIQGNFAPWVGALLMDVRRPLLLVADNGKEEEAITRLSRVGFDNVIGFLEGGIASWQSAGLETDRIASITPEAFADEYSNDSTVVDSRKPGEFAADHVSNAINLPLDFVNSQFDMIPKSHFYIHCAGGYRSVIMASILKARGIHHMTNVEKGMSGIRNTTIPLNQPAASH
jgi:rhodanese-related sulfurtransferase